MGLLRGVLVAIDRPGPLCRVGADQRRDDHTRSRQGRGEPQRLRRSFPLRKAAPAKIAGVEGQAAEWRWPHIQN
eukprot:scaffold4361_cov121-Isochrysis_galbana.AAC.3